MSERPKEGVYLDAALAVIGEQVEERIDELDRRRRRRARVGVSALVAATLLSGSAAAYAIAQSHRPPHQAPIVEVSETRQLSCVEGADASAPAYFTVSYRADPAASVDAMAVCADARSTLASETARIARSSPVQLVAIATRLLKADAADRFTVEAASFGTISADPATPVRVCGDGDATVVLVAPPDAGSSPPIVVCSAGSR
ncbi:hypothetical protein L2X99_01830 [Microbacterium sp. KUDC0406]|uniref:hypothetical protein n=1 Tax=Microbacterium sp. KUDC0406 TaxID=2909588 RepID=UPI001F322B07|nr:hypothetical protein [Microbacterium sp. KUDC0406]UJP10463.1 hypothetical protein L2X99_01830 [Microbacterium sp. KUDC0406]